MLAAEGLSVALSGRPVLTGIDLKLRAGELVVIAGPNGAGKSTLLKALTGLAAPSAGRVLLDRKTLSLWPLADLARRRAVLAQSHETGFPFTVFELVTLGARAAGNAAAMPGEVARCLAAVDLAGYGHRLIQELSGGERQRAHIARVLCQLGGDAAASERWLFLDEPTAGLDLAHQLAVLDLAKAHARGGGGAVAILHDLNLAALFADRMLLLDKGRLIDDGPPESVLTPANVAAVFGGRLKLLRDAGRLYILPTLQPHPADAGESDLPI